VWQLVFASDTENKYPCPIEEELVVTYDPESGELYDNISDYLRELDLGRVNCQSNY
jgi:hypothetical protein